MSKTLEPKRPANQRIWKTTTLLRVAKIRAPK